jgi:hypothetical protein
MRGESVLCARWLAVGIAASAGREFRIFAHLLLALIVGAFFFHFGFGLSIRSPIVLSCCTNHCRCVHQFKAKRAQIAFFVGLKH